MMSADLDQFLFDVTRGGQRSAYLSDADGVIASSGLGEALRAAFGRRDIEALWRAGAHPMLLLYFARLNGIAAPDYYATVTRAGDRQHQPSGE